MTLPISHTANGFTCNITRLYFHKVQSINFVFTFLQEGGEMGSKSNTEQEMFQKHKFPHGVKIQVYLLCRSKTCPKQVSKGLKYIKWTTHWAQKSGLTLTFEHVT